MRSKFLFVLPLLLAAPAWAAVPSTSTGRISAAQIFDLSQRSQSDDAARNMLKAYLIAIGETVGVLADAAGDRGLALGCQQSFSLSEEAAMAALKTALPDPAAWAEAAAAPIIVADIFARAGCD